MDLTGVLSMMSRALFTLAFLLLAVGVLERIVFAFGYTILRGTFSGGRLLEIAALMLVFVIALLLRQIREDLKSRSA